ncbi:MAG: cell division protein FtsA [Elusimicrobia bacterium]|nr:cell division protein FtsA [Elusimicrobiota bacterium]
MPKANAVCAIDVGSSKIVGVLAKVDAAAKTPYEVLAGSRIDCRGIRGGVVVNIPETARAIMRAVEQCEEQARSQELAPITELVLAVRGAHIQSFNNKGAFNIARTDKEITPADVDSVLNIAHAVQLSQDREVLHVVAQDFWVDRQKGVLNPVGMEGSLLEVDVHILTAISSHLNNISKAVGQAGFKANRLVYGMLALGECVVTDEEKQQGCLLMDVGGQTLGIGVYLEGTLRYSKELPVGSDFITRDLAYAMRTSVIHADRLKEEHGACLSSLVTLDEEVEFPAIDGREMRRAKKKQILEIVQPRVEEIFAMAAKDLEAAGWLDAIVPGGAILVGGGSRLRGLAEASQELFGVPSRLGLPQIGDALAPEEFLNNPTFTTALSLLHFVQHPPLWGEKANGKRRRSLDNGMLGAKSRNGLTRKMQSFFEEIFS